MAILIDSETRVVCQGMTGWAGAHHTAAMIEYGTKVVAGVTPTKGGRFHLGAPVFDSVAAAAKETGANASMVFVPPAQASAAIIEATARGLAAPPVKSTIDDRNDEPTPTGKFKADAVWTAAQAICQSHGIDPMMGASRTEIGKLTWALWSGRDVPKGLSVMTGWRKALLGEPLANLIRNGGEVSIKI